MTTAHSNKKFFQLLEQFETRLETPVVPGELPDWSQDALEEIRAARREFEDQVQGTHAGIFQDIAEENAEMLGRVSELRETDEELKSQLGKLEEEFEALTEFAELAEPDESQLASQLEKTIQSGLRFVIAARRQEHALTTWYQEAFERDGGIAD